jgi:hypothetical protein
MIGNQRHGSVLLLVLLGILVIAISFALLAHTNIRRFQEASRVSMPMKLSDSQDASGQ